MRVGEGTYSSIYLNCEKGFKDIGDEDRNDSGRYKMNVLANYLIRVTQYAILIALRAF